MQLPLHEEEQGDSGTPFVPDAAAAAAAALAEDDSLPLATYGAGAHQAQLLAAVRPLTLL
jgi:hypothetical protein